MDFRQWAMQIIEQTMSVVHDTLSGVPLVVWLFVLFVVFCLYKAVSDSNYECGLMSEHFGDRLKSNSKFNKQFYETVHRIALREHGKPDTDEFWDYEDKIYCEMDALIFSHNLHSSKDVVTFNPDFCSWLMGHDPNAKVYDFPKHMTHYRQYLELQRCEQLNDELDKKRLHTDILAAMDRVKRDRASKLYFASRESTTKQDIVTVYNNCVQDIKKDGHGLMPVKLNECPQSVYRHLYTTVVLSNRILHKIFEVDYNEIDVAGCAIVFNTYTEKYLIIKSGKIYTALKDLLDGQTIEYAATFGADLLIGHLPLVRVVPLDRSGYTNLDLLYKCLIRSYDACEPHGYNSPKSLDI